MFHFNSVEPEVLLKDSPESKTLELISKDIELNTYGILDIKEPKLIIDAGAHVGMFTIWLAKKYPKAKIYALEPFYKNYQNLCYNVQYNNVLENVIPLNIGLSSDGRKIAMASYDFNTGGACPMLSFEEPTIPTITLDNFIDKVIPKNEIIDFIKIDIEGMEYEVLENFTQWDRIKDLGIEIHAKPGFHKPIEGWKNNIINFENWLKTKPIKGKLWYPPQSLYDQ